MKNTKKRSETVSRKNAEPQAAMNLFKVSRIFRVTECIGTSALFSGIFRAITGTESPFFIPHLG